MRCEVARYLIRPANGSRKPSPIEAASSLAALGRPRSKASSPRRRSQHEMEYRRVDRHGRPEPLRDVILSSRHDTIAYEDITGLPWIEIDYAVDVERATAEILPRIVAAARLGHPAMTTGGEAGRATYYE